MPWWQCRVFGEWGVVMTSEIEPLRFAKDINWLDADLNHLRFEESIVGLDTKKFRFSTRLENILYHLVKRSKNTGLFREQRIDQLPPTTTWRQILDLERHQLLSVKNIGLKTLDELERAFWSLNVRPRWAFKKPKRPYPISAACSGIGEEMSDSFKARCAADRPHPYKQWQNVAVVFGRTLCESECRALAEWLGRAAKWIAAQ